MQREQEIHEHYQATFKEGWITGVHGVKLRYAMPQETNAQTALVIIGGRTEPLEKYREVFFDLRSLDVAIYSYDHRGQGLSDRLLADHRKGHVESFLDYVEDLHIFLEQLVGCGSRHDQIFVLAHSMGGAIAALFHHNYPGVLAGLVFTAPMFGIHSRPLSTPVAEWLAAIMVRSGRGENYIFGRGAEVYNLEYANNPLTSSTERFAYSLRVFAENPKLALGSPSFNWLHEAYYWLRKIRKITFEHTNTNIPMLLLQAECDRVVTASAQRQFLKNNPSCDFLVIAGARHELLMEVDAIRDEVLDLIRGFVNKHR